MTEPGSAGWLHRLPRLLPVVTLVLLLGGYAWTAVTANPRWATRNPDGYYALLTEAFLSGQTYLKGQPDPRLALLANPYLGAQGVPRLHDATYFHGRYYLYFGAAPVILLYAPWCLLTGTYLTDGAGTAVFATVGFLAGGALLWCFWRRWFSQLWPGWLAVALLLWGGANYALVLVEASSVYPVPITCAYALLLTAQLALWAALQGGPPWRVLCWLGLGSVLWAGTVACRPNYIFSLPVMAVPLLAIWTAWAEAAGPDRRRRLLPGLAAAGPVLAVGFAIAAYNWVRFHNVFEFGVSYMFTGGDSRQVRLVDAGRLLANLRYFVLEAPRLRPYFPFQAPGEGGFGLLGCVPFTALALLFPWSLWDRTRRGDRLWWAPGASLLGVFVLNLISLGVFFSNERYVLDFLPAAMLLALVNGLSLLDWCRRNAGTRRWSVLSLRLLVTALAVVSLGQAGIFAMSRYPDQRRLAPLARPVDRLIAGVEPLIGIKYGPLEFRATFQPKPGRVDPLVVSGDGRDVLSVSYPAADRIQFGFFHAGDGGPTSDPLPIDPGHPYDLKINLGSLYPPRDHPAFAGWSDVESEVIHRVVSVRLDGREVLDGASAFYPSDPWHLEIGRNRGGLVSGPRFSGRLEPIGARRIPPPAELRSFPLTGSVRLTLRIPPFDVYKTEPLISTGHALAGDLIFLTYLGKDRIRFGHDSWNGGAVVSPPVDYQPGKPCTLEVAMGSLRPLPGSRPVEAPLVLRFNGQLLFQDRRPFYPTTGPEVAFGFNGMQSSISTQIFSGQIRQIVPLAAAALRVPSATGPLHLVVRFPQAPGASEPLVVTGRTGAGDLVYVTYLDGMHLCVGYDHWMVGGPRGAPIALDYGSPHDVEIFLGSLLPPPADPWWGATPPAARAELRRRVRVTIDGAVALETTGDPYPAGPDQVYVAANPIGGSTCRPSFSGRIFLAERRGPEAFSAPAP